MSNLKVVHKLLLAFAILVAAVATAGAMVGGSLSSIQKITRLNDHGHVYINTLDDTTAALVEQQNATRGFVASLDPSFVEKYGKYGADYDKGFKKLVAGVEDADEKTRTDALATAVAVFREETSKQIANAGDPLTLEQARAEIGTGGRLTNIRKILKDIAADEDRQLAIRSAEQSKAFASATITLLIGGAVAVGIAVLMGWLLSTSIAAPVTAMTAAMRRLADGDNEVAVPAVGRKDEIGGMAAAVLTFKQAALEKLRLAGEAEGQRRQVEQERQSNEAGRSASAREQSGVVTRLGEGLECLAKGDLTFRLDEVFPESYRKLQSDFNAAMDRLAETMAGINGAVGGISAGSGEISHAADDLSRRTEQQAASLEETAAALDEIVATVRRAAAPPRARGKPAARSRLRARTPRPAVRLWPAPSPPWGRSKARRAKSATSSG